MSTPNIFTMTLSIHLGYSINLLNIAKYIEVGGDSPILGLKYIFGGKHYLKGTYTSSRSTANFSNQVSLVVQTANKKINTKVFSTGKLQLTGCKSTSDAYDVKTILLDLFEKCNGQEEYISLIQNKPVLMDLDHYIYSPTGRCIGYYIPLTKDYMIDNKPCTLNENGKMYITKNKDMHLYDYYGNLMGAKKIHLFRNGKKIYNKSSLVEDANSGLLMYNDIPVGKIEYNYVPPNVPKVPSLPDHTMLSYKKDILSGDTGDTGDIEIYSIMFSFSLNVSIHRENLYQHLLTNGFMTKFDPNRYSGVYWMLKIEYDEHGNVHIKKGTGVSIILFQTGSVLCSGVKREQDIYPIYNYICQYLQLYFLSK